MGEIAVDSTIYPACELIDGVEVAFGVYLVIPAFAFEKGCAKQEDGRAANRQDIEGMEDKLCGVTVRRIGEDALIRRGMKGRETCREKVGSMTIATVDDV